MKAVRLMKMFGILAVTLSVSTGCSALDMFKQQDRASEVQVPSVTTVRAEEIVKQRIAEPVEVAAQAQSSQQLDITAQVSGEVKQLLKKRGESVKAGEAIATLSSEALKEERESASLAVRDVKAEIQEAKKSLAASKKEKANAVRKMKLDLDTMTRKYNKMKNDYDSGKVSTAELEEMETKLNQLRIDYELERQASVNEDATAELQLKLAEAEAKLQATNEAFKALELKSPLSGIITQLSITEGMSVSSGVPIGQVVKVEPINIKAFLNEEAVTLAGGKDQLTYYLPDTEMKWRGKVTYLATVMDPETNAYELNLEVPNPEYMLKPGMNLILQLTEETEQIVIGIPQYSVIMEDGESFVFVVADDLVEKRKVQLGRSNDLYYEVLSGVTEGEFLVVSGQAQLSDGEKVLVR